MPQITVIIITLNEEKNIGRCIQSVQGIADEILVVDSFSSDNTEAVAKNLGARFIQHPFEDYVAQHIYADSQATHDIILSLDADEALSEDLAHSIKKIKKYWKNDGYFMNRKTNYCGKWIKHCGWYPDKKLRLYNRTKGQWNGKKIHEHYILKHGGTTGHLQGDILHYSFNSISEHIAQANKFTDLTAAAAFENGVKSNYFKLLFSPAFKFFRDYFINRGFLDGYYGYVICRISAHATFLKYSKLRQLNKASGLD